LCALFAAVLTRLAYLQTGTRAAVAADTGEKTVAVAQSRGYIYDRNLVPLVNTETRNVAAVLLCGATRELVPGGAVLLHGSRDAQNVLVTFETETPVKETPCSVNVRTVVRYGARQLCTHLIGYTDAAGSGVCGIEKSYDKILNDAAGNIGVSYTANGLGEAIAGVGIKIKDENYDSPAGVVLTIDVRAQRIAEEALYASEIKKGAAVVLAADTGEILALASVPAYNVNDVAASLQDPDLPFLNRALATYPVGSVFKPFVAAAAMEHGVICPENYECTGQTGVGELSFRCYSGVSHGEIGLSGAIERSCNCYFISLGQTLGAEALTETAALFGFGRQIRLTGDILSSAGNLPDKTRLSSPGALANLSFGQGELLASPLQLAAAFAAIANGGVYRAPYLTKALVDGTKKEYAYYKNETENRAASEETCKILSVCLRQNMLGGTGKTGASELFAAAGKTATAQTGDIKPDGTERLCTWFCGYFPYEAPRFVVAVFNEDGAFASEDCAPVFRAISEGIYYAGL
jgi:cell division protein FtsI/penicillin-binding protein 2